MLKQVRIGKNYQIDGRWVKVTEVVTKDSGRKIVRFTGADGDLFFGFKSYETFVAHATC